MADFDPDAYLAAKAPAPVAATPAGGFDPDAYLAQRTAPPSIAADVATSLPVGLLRGAMGVAGTRGDLRDLRNAAIDKFAPTAIAGPAKKVLDFGDAVSGLVSPFPNVSSGDLAHMIERVTGPLPQPQTMPGRFVGTAAEFAPALFGGEGSVGARLLKNVALPAIASEAAGEATQGTAAAPYARAAAALAGGGIGPAVERATAARTAAAAIPSAQDLLASGGAKFDQARNMGVQIKPQSVQDFATRVKSDIDQGLGVDANLAPKTHGILDDVIAGPPAGQGAVATIDNLQSLRRKLGNAAGSIDKTERMAASSAKGALDDYLANLPSADVIAGNPQAASALLKSANADYAAGSRANAVNAKVVRAELRAAAANSGQNVANTIRQRMADILINPSLQRGYSADELAQIQRIVRGTVTGNVARFAKNIFGGGGGIGSLITGGIGAAAAGGPAGLALMAPGLAGRVVSDASTMRQVRILDQMIRSRAPLSAAQAVPAMQPERLAMLRRLLLANAATVPSRQPAQPVNAAQQ